MILYVKIFLISLISLILLLSYEDVYSSSGILRDVLEIAQVLLILFIGLVLVPVGIYRYNINKIRSTL